jgi:hypothetical protein
LDTNLAHAQASAWATEIVHAYEQEISGSAEGLHGRITEAITVAMVAGSDARHWAPRVNWAIDTWERTSSRTPGPRVGGIDEASGEVEII